LLDLRTFRKYDTLCICDLRINHKNLRISDSGMRPRIFGIAFCGLQKKFACPLMLFYSSALTAVSATVLLFYAFTVLLFLTMVWCSLDVLLFSSIKGDFGIFQYFIQHGFICRPSDSTVSEDAGIEPGAVATSALAVPLFLPCNSCPC
jgi:hypothetical protein